MFDHVHVDFGYDDLLVQTKPEGRRYQTPEGLAYPSATTVLGYGQDDWISSWKERVGEKEARRVSHHATTRGTIVHDLMERYVRGEEIDTRRLMPHHHKSYLNVKKILDERLSSVYCLEKALYSDHLRMAGRVDMVGVFDSVMSVIDFKTSTKIKKKEWIDSYFLQTSAYSIMFEERTGIPVPNVVIVMDVDNKDPIVFKEHRDNWTRELLEKIDYYYKETGWKP